MAADSLAKIIEGVQQHFPQHSREVIKQYYEYIEKNVSQEYPDDGLQMVSRICGLVHKIQRQRLHPVWPETGFPGRIGYNPMAADSLAKIIEGVQQHFPQHSRKVILKYYKYVENSFSQEFSDDGLEMVSRICGLVHKIQGQLHQDE